jgi:hypothetical protein
MNLFDVKSKCFAKEAQLAAMSPIFNKAIATRSPFGMPCATRISK